MRRNVTVFIFTSKNYPKFRSTFSTSELKVSSTNAVLKM